MGERLFWRTECQNCGCEDVVCESVFTAPPSDSPDVFHCLACTAAGAVYQPKAADNGWRVRESYSLEFKAQTARNDRVAELVRVLRYLGVLKDER